MKTIKYFTVIMAFFCFITTANQANAQAKKEAKTSEFKIKVMFDCAKGKALIEKELIKESGIKKVLADVENKTVTINFDGKTTDRIKINAAIEKIGYQTELSSKDKKIESPCKKTCTNKQ
jgi:copper chaperone CopZ